MLAEGDENPVEHSQPAPAHEPVVERLVRTIRLGCIFPLQADRAYSSAASRQALTDQGITPCIPPHAKHRIQHHYDRVLYRQRHRIENMFARLKDWRRIHTRYDRCAHTFLSAIAFAATFIFRINES